MIEEHKLQEGEHTVQLDLLLEIMFNDQQLEKFECKFGRMKIQSLDTFKSLFGQR